MKYFVSREVECVFFFSIQEKGALCMCVLRAGIEYSSVASDRVQVVSSEASGTGCLRLRHATGLGGK